MSFDSCQQSTKNSNTTLPDGWRWVKLTELLVALETGSRPKGGAQGIQSGVPSLSAEHMTRFGTFDFSELRFVPREFYEKMPRGHIKRNDLLIVKDGATTGKTVFVDETFPYSEAVINEHVYLCRPDLGKVHPLYLFYLLWGPVGLAQIRQGFQGAAIGGINKSFTEKVIIPLPPLAEQQHIVAWLNEQMAAVAQARKAAEEQLRGARALSTLYLREIFDNQLAITFPIKTLADVCRDITDGTHVTPLYVPQGVPFLSVKDVKETGLSFDDCRYISSEQHRELTKRYQPERGDVLYTKVGTTGIAKAVDIDREFSIFVSVALLKLKRDIILPEYLERVLNSPFCRVQAEELTQGMANRNLVLKDLKRIELPLPPIDEQLQVTHYLAEKLSSVEALRNLAKSQLAEINCLPSALLRRAFSGELL